MGEGPNRIGLSRRAVLYECEQSLRRLGTEWIDVYFAHRFDPLVPMEEVLHAFDTLRAQGKIRYFGVSNWAAWQIAKALGASALKGLVAPSVMQPMYNLVKRQAEVELFPLAMDAGMGVMVYNPLAAGVLTGKYGAAGAGPGRLAESEMYRKRYREDWMYTAAQDLQALAAEAGLSPVSLAVAWAARHPAVTCPIIGARSVEQLEPALRAPEIRLSDELYERMRALAPSPPPATDRTDDVK
jgi:aryl-alcohol dehydrogenase-like predicted oxidoreductase